MKKTPCNYTISGIYGEETLRNKIFVLVCVLYSKFKCIFGGFRLTKKKPVSPRSFWNLTDMVPVWFLFISPLMLLKEFIIHTNLFQKHPFIKIHVLNEIHWWSIWGLRCSKRFYGAIAHILLAPVQCCLWVGVAGSGCLVASFNEHFTMHLCTKQLIDRCAVWWRGRR